VEMRKSVNNHDSRHITPSLMTGVNAAACYILILVRT
jgi:hypothetical protein